MRSTKKRASSATSSLQLQLPTPKKRVVLSDLTNSPDVGSTRNSEDFAPNKPKCENNGAYPNCELDEPTKSETVISSTCMIISIALTPILYTVIFVPRRFSLLFDF